MTLHVFLIPLINQRHDVKIPQITVIFQFNLRFKVTLIVVIHNSFILRSTTVIESTTKSLSFTFY